MSRGIRSPALYGCNCGHLIVSRSSAPSLVRHCPTCHEKIEFLRLRQTPRTQHCGICLMPVVETG